MDRRQQQVVEAFQRARAFLSEHPATWTRPYTIASAMLVPSGSWRLRAFGPR